MYITGRAWGSSVHKTDPSVIILAGASISVHIHSTPQDVALRHAARRALEIILPLLRGDLCTILHPNFGELIFHALR
jgi:hypothetical protein